MTKNQYQYKIALDETVDKIVSKEKKNAATFQKLQEYVNAQTEYMNEVMNSKDDVLENFGNNISQLLKDVSELNSKLNTQNKNPLPAIPEQA